MKRLSIDDNYLVSVKSNFDGRLRFELGGYNEVWYEIGEEQELTWEEIKEIRKRARGFFELNWIILVHNHCDGIHRDHPGPISTPEFLQALFLVGSDVSRGDDQVHLVVHERVEGVMLVDVFGHDARLGVLVLKHGYLLLQNTLERLVTHDLGDAARARALGHLGVTGDQRQQHDGQQWQ